MYRCKKKNNNTFLWFSMSLKKEDSSLLKTIFDPKSL